VVSSCLLVLFRLCSAVSAEAFVMILDMATRTLIFTGCF
jgi:hypothetical protein